MPNINQVLFELKCCLADKPEHYLEKPKLLYCGHLICTKCCVVKPDDEEDDGIKCCLCDKTSSFNITEEEDEAVVIEQVQNLITEYLNDLAQSTYLKLSKIGLDIKNKIDDVFGKIENQVEFLNGEIEIRIESLKEKLNEIGESLKKQLKDAKDKMKGCIVTPVNIEQLDFDLDGLKECIRNKSINETEFYDFNTKYIQLCGEYDRIKKFDFTMNFDINESFNMDDKSVGSVFCNYNSLINTLEASNHEFIRLKYPSKKILKLKNGNFLISSYESNPTAIYDENFKFIKKFDKINNEIELDISGHVCDADGNIYISNGLDFCLYKLDTDLELKKQQNFSRFKTYGDICIHDNRLYICVNPNSIEIFDLNLNLLSTHYLNALPTQIRILNDVACVQLDNPSNKTCFYRLPSFDFLHEYDVRGPILAHDRWFFLYDSYFRVYDKNGKWVKSLDYDYSGTKYYNTDVGLIDGTVYLCLDDNYIAKISLN